MEKKVLVVDDEDFHRELMQKLLSKMGYEVAVAESAEEAFSLLKAKKYILIYLMMKLMLVTHFLN